MDTGFDLHEGGSCEGGVGGGVGWNSGARKLSIRGNMILLMIVAGHALSVVVDSVGVSVADSLFDAPGVSNKFSPGLSWCAKSDLWY
jgi:hypothetical protein